MTFAFLLQRSRNQDRSDCSASRPGRTSRVDLLGGKKSSLSHFLSLMDGRLVEGGKVRLIKEGGPFGGTKTAVHWLQTGRTHAKCSCWSRSLRKKGKKSACMSNHLKLLLVKKQAFQNQQPSTFFVSNLSYGPCHTSVRVFFFL